MKKLFSTVLETFVTARARLKELADLLEYPEIQADKGYYLSLLSEYNDLKGKVEIADELQKCVDDYETIEKMPVASGEEELISKEKEALFDRAVELRAELLSFDHGREKVAYRIAAESDLSLETANKLFSSLLPFLSRDGGGEEPTIKNGETFFSVEGKGAVVIATELVGRHRIKTPSGKNERFVVTATEVVPTPEYREEDFRFSVFHSSGAGGQNINKVETAVRVTYLPTGLTVTCQDERSQLKNKRRAYENILKRLRADFARAEKEREEEERRLQEKRKGDLTVDVVKNELVDEKIGVFPYPLTPDAARRYIEEKLLREE